MVTYERATQIAESYTKGDKNPHRHIKCSPNRRWALYTRDIQDMRSVLTTAPFEHKHTLTKGLESAERKAEAAYRNESFDLRKAHNELVSLQKED